MKKSYLNLTKEQLSGLIEELRDQLENGCIVFLEGDPGAGKTFLISELLWHYQISDVVSPTFALHNRYQSGEIMFHHFDLYRVESEDELETVGLWDLMATDTNAIFLIEWASKFMSDIWPMDRKKIKIEISLTRQNSRDYQVSRLD